MMRIFNIFILILPNFLSQCNGMNVKSNEIGGSVEERKLLPILFCADNLYISHFQLSIQLANILAETGLYHVHFLVADHTPEKEVPYGDLHKSILLIRVPVDQAFLKREFLDKAPRGAFSNWSEELNTFDKPDFWQRFRTYTICLFQAVIQNPLVRINDLEINILVWLRGVMASESPYMMGLAEYGVSASAFSLFHQLGVEQTVAISSATPLPAFYHFLGMQIPSNIPEFFSAQPKAIILDKERNKAEYKRTIGKIEKLFYEKNLEMHAKLRKEANRNGIEIKPMKPLGDLLRNCKLFFTNQPNSVEFPWKVPKQMFKYIGGIAIKHLDMFAAKFNKAMPFVNNKWTDLQWKPKANCVVLFSLGTIVNFEGFSRESVENMFNAFGQQKQCNFLVRFDKQLKIENKPKNVEIVDFKTFIAQQEILAVYAGVPLLCIPFFYDQPYNAAIVEHLDIGIWVKPMEFAIKGKFSKALRDILHENKYKNAVRKIAKKLHSGKKPTEIFLEGLKPLKTLF